MRRAVLILVGLAVVASLPTPELTQEEFLKLLQENQAEDNDLFHNDERTQSKEDVLRGEGQGYVLPSVQVQEPTVQEIANDAEEQDQVQQPEAKPQQEGSESREKQNGQEVPKVEQEETEPEGEQIKEETELGEQTKEETEPEEQIKEETEPEGEQIKEEPQVEVKQTDAAKVETEQVSPSEPAEQAPLVPGMSELTPTSEAKEDTGIIVVGQEGTEIEPSQVDFPEGGETFGALEPQEYSTGGEKMIDFFGWFHPKFTFGENQEEELRVSELYSDSDEIIEPEDGTQIDAYSPETPVIKEASERPEGFYPHIPEDYVVLKDEDIDEPYPDYPTEVEGPADEPPLQDDVSLVDFFIPSHETLIYEGALGEDFSREEVPEEGFSREEFPEEGFSREGFPEEGFSREEFPEEGFSREEVPEEEFFHEEVPEEEFFHEEVPEEEFFHEEVPEEEFFHEEVPEEEFFHEEVPEEEFFHEEVPEEGFSHEEVPEEEIFYGAIVPQVEEVIRVTDMVEMLPEPGSYMPEEEAALVVLPEEVPEDEAPTDETDARIIFPRADYFGPTDHESEFVPDDTPIIMIEEQPLHSGYSLGEYGDLSINPELLEPLIHRFPVEEYAEYARFPIDTMDSPRPDMGEPFFMPETEDTSSNSDGDAVDIFVMDATPQDFEDTDVDNMSVSGEQVMLEEQPAPIAVYLEQPEPIAEYTEEIYQEPIMVGMVEQIYTIPDNSDDDDHRIIFPDDTEPTRNLPIFPYQWNEDSHFTPPKEQQTTPDDQVHLLPVTGETETENMPPREDDDIPPPILLQPEIPPQDTPDFMNSRFPPIFEPTQERDDTNPRIYLGPSMLQNFIPSSSQQNLNNYNTVRQPSPTDYTIPHHIHRPIDFPQHFNGPSGFPEHFHGPSGFPEHFHGPSDFPEHFHGPSGFPEHFHGPSGFPEHFHGPSGFPEHFHGPSGFPQHFNGPSGFPQHFNGPSGFPQHQLRPDSQSPTGPKTIVQGPIMRYEPFYGPNGEPPMRESSPLFRTSSMSDTLEKLNQHEPQLDIEIYPIEVTFTPDDDSFGVSSYSSSPPQYPAFNFLRRPYFRTQYSSSYEDPVYVGQAMYPNTGLYPPTPTRSRYAPDFVTQQNNPDPSRPYSSTW